MLSLFIYSSFCGTFVGVDAFNNRYYRSTRDKDSFGREKRFVIYNGIPEASKIPADWQMWLNHQLVGAPVLKRKKYSWEAQHSPNLTGTKEAYTPPGSFCTGTPAGVTGDYESWRPSGD